MKTYVSKGHRLMDSLSEYESAKLKADCDEALEFPCPSVICEDYESDE